MKKNNGLNPDGYSKKDFLQLKIAACPFCESETVVQWFDEKTKTKHFACFECDYYSEEKFIEVSWTGEDED